MNVRILSFYKGLTCNLDCFHQVIADDGGIALEGMKWNAETFLGIPIESLIWQAQQKEWGAFLNGTICKDINLLAEKDSRVQGIMESLQKGPWAFSQDNLSPTLFKTCDKLDIYDTASLDRRIPAEAKKILGLKTILLFPNTSQNAVLMPEAELVMDIAKELIQKLDKSGLALNIALVQVRSPNRSQHPENSLFEALMKALFSQTTQLIFDDGLHKKEGPLLIEGASGTGKSQAAMLLANQLGKKLHEINLAALTDNLLESKMRGHIKGAFTGADKDTPGFFESADGQVLFLDELQSASLPSQTQLLDLLSAVSNQVRISKMGKEAQRETYSVKVVLATNRPASELLEKGLLREDLFHRIRDIIHFKSLNELLAQDNYAIRISKLLKLYRWQSFPAISASEQDLLELAVDLLFPEFEHEIFQSIQKSNWPGNFRQLERFSYDLYWRLTYQNPALITQNLVEELLNRERNRFNIKSGTELRPEETDENKRIVKYIEEIITKNNMNIGKSCKEFGPYKLASRQTLRAFLLKNRNHLSDKFINDSRIFKFMQLST